MNDSAADFLRRRRNALAKHPTQIGLDFVTVEADPHDVAKRWLVLNFIPVFSPAPPGVTKTAAPASLTREQLTFRSGGVPVDSLFTFAPGSADPLIFAGSAVTLPIVFAGDADLARRLGNSPVFTVELQGVPNLDPFFARADFSLDPEAPRVDDCSGDSCPPDGGAAAAVPPFLASDYLAKDYASFRQRMLDNLAQRLPQWTERSPADLLVTLVELLADAGDQASYYQDAVATEAYLGTARLRISVRRHARLVGYLVHEGTNARTWVQLAASPAIPGSPGSPSGVTLPAGTPILTQVPGLPFLLAPGSADLARALAANATVFETVDPVTVWTDLGEMTLYAWGADRIVLPAGATSAFLLGAYLTSFPHLVPGVVLVLEQARGPATGEAADADPDLRHVVIVTAVTAVADPLGSGGQVDLTRIDWGSEDALPFALPLANRVGSDRFADLAVARGNLVMADHGQTVESELLSVPEGRFRPRLARRGLTHRVSTHQVSASAGRGAGAALAQTAEASLPALALVQLPPDPPAMPPMPPMPPMPHDPPPVWTLKRDLLASDRFAHDFVVEMESDGTAVLRFGDGTLGRPPAPGSQLSATYRVGNGAAGNLGRGSLYHLVSDASDASEITGLHNPLPATGGVDPETIDHIRIAAPGSIDVLATGSEVSDVVARVEADPAVERAAARLRWTGSWYLLEVAVQRTGGKTLGEDDFAAKLAASLEDLRIASWELAVIPLELVGLDIALTVVLAPDAVRGEVERALLDAFSNRDLPGGGRDLPAGGRGFFHPANLGFGQPVYLSQIVAAALRVPGVRALDIDETPPKPNRFHRFGEPSRGELAAGEIRLGRNEIARVDNDPAAPENGRIQFYLEGGR